MRPVNDRRLSEPFKSWIDKSKPLPAGVTLLPRAIRVGSDLWTLADIGSSLLIFAGVVFFLVIKAKSDFNAGVTFFVVLVSLLCFGVPLLLAHRLWRSMEASRDLQAGNLRQGVFIGSEGILVRLAPHRCYPIALARFVKTEAWSGGSEGSGDFLKFETLDGSFDVDADYLTVGAFEINRTVAAARSSRRRERAAARG